MRSWISTPLLTTTLVLGTAIFGIGCSDAPPDLAPIAQSESEIINGSLDTTHQAVVAVLSSNSACTGTIIQVDPPFAFILTAAHCVDDPPQVVVQGDDYNAAGAIQYNVQEYLAHPGYNGSVNDFAMVRVTGAGAATPTIPVLTPAEDDVNGGEVLRHVGYGVIGAPSTGTTRRHTTTNSVTQTSNLTLTFNATSSGVCFGDSGGPNLHNGKVAGVNSSVSTNQCNGASFSGRASAILSSFITPFINNAPPPPVDCDGCFEAATTGTGTCSNQVQSCLSNSACNALVGCINGCGTQSCVNACFNSNAGGVAMYEAIFDCVCDVGCNTECGNAPMCQDGGNNPTTASNAVASSAVAADAAATTGAGGGGAGGAGGGSSATGQGSGWFNGNGDGDDPEGTIVGSGCSYGEGEGGSAAAWLLAFVGLAVLRRRRST